LAGNGQFDVAVANISARAVGERAPHILPTLIAGGHLIASGLMESQRQDVETVLLDLGFTYINEWHQEEWVTLVYRSPIT
jgi:ribosomal protein L11 methylase PrmA